MDWRIYRLTFLLLLVITDSTFANYMEQCVKTPIEENVTLKGGIGAGTFKKMGKVTEMKSCIQLCCKAMSCDVAFMSAQNCYAVECVSDDECESTTTDTSDVQVLIAHVKKKAKKANSTLDVLANPGLLAKKNPLATGANPAMAGMAGQCKPGRTYQEVTLRGGINAGTYKDTGMVSNMAECQKKCCGFSSCDLAFLLGGRCYLVGCADEKSCQMNKAKPSPYTPMISYVTRWNTEGVKHTVHFDRPNNDTKFQCPKMEQLDKVTLKGGLKSGDFTDVGKVGKLEDCYDICCKSEKCNLAFMLGQNCFSVKCYTDDLCKTIPAQPSIFNPQIAYIVNREKITLKSVLQDQIQGNNIQTITHVTCPKGHVVDKVTLVGGLNAGKYRDHGKVQNIQQCRRICCELPKCNVAFMIAENCFSVECKTEGGCRTQPALTSPYHPEISYVRFIGSANIIGVYDDLNNTAKNATKSLDDLLTAGKDLEQLNLQPNAKNQKQIAAKLQEKAPQIPQPQANKPTQKGNNVTGAPTKSNFLLINGETKDLASALQKGSPAMAKPKLHNNALKGQLAKAKAGQAMSLQVVNGEIKLMPTTTDKKNGQSKATKAKINNLKWEKTAKKPPETEKLKTQHGNSQCKAQKRMKDVTLTGGKNAGKFEEHGLVESMETCLDFCCQNKKCNLVLMLGKTCYTVECKDKKSCQTSPAPPSEFTPELAIVREVKKVQHSRISEMPNDLKCNYKPITNDQKLVKGRKAGTFKLAEGITNMEKCMVKCCDESMCDLVYLKNRECYTVTCNSPESCGTEAVGEDEDAALMAFTSPVETPNKNAEPNMEERESPSTTRTRDCKPSKITRNTKLKGAKLTDMGAVDDLETCIKHCCSKDSCDVAYMEEEKCYAVQCQDGQQCKSFREPAKKDENILIAYMQRSINDAEKEKDWVIVYVIVGSLVCASGLSGIIWASCICVKRNRLRNNRRLLDDVDEEEEEEMIPKKYSRRNNRVPERYR